MDAIAHYHNNQNVESRWRVSDLAKEIWVSPAAVGGFFRAHKAEARDRLQSSTCT